MRFAFSANAFRLYTLFETINIISSTGYEGIEIMADIPHAYPTHLSDEDIEAIRDALAQNTLEVSNINAFMHHADGDTYHPTWIEKDPALRTRRIDYTLQCIDLAWKLGADTISTEPGGPLEDMTREEGIRVFLEGLRVVEGKARERGVRILIEPEPGLLIENSTQFLELFEHLDPAVFGLNFDIGHFFCVGEDPSQLIRKMKDVIYHFHLEDIADTREHHHLMPGMGAIDLHGVLRTIEEIGFEGFVTVELYTYEYKAGQAAYEAFHYLDEWRRLHSGQH